jgi:hypothetical protein
MGSEPEPRASREGGGADRQLVARTRDYLRTTVLPVDGAHDGDIEAAGGSVAAARSSGPA